jgi:hypothetical protein
LGIVINRTTIRIVEKHDKAQFIAAWILTTIEEVGDKFHQKLSNMLASRFM